MSRSSQTTEQIERELAALGEAPPSAEELALLGLAAGDDADDLDDADDAEARLDADPDLATLARLTELASAEAQPGLSEIELHRVWRKLEQHAGAAESSERARATRPAGATQQATPAGGGPRRWLLAATGLAAAAAVLLIIVRPQPQQGPSAEDIAALGEQVRVSLRAVDDGKSDSERASELANDYQRRLAAQQERGG